jgi:hypothetical protein
LHVIYETAVRVDMHAFSCNVYYTLNTKLAVLRMFSIHLIAIDKRYTKQGQIQESIKGGAEVDL